MASVQYAKIFGQQAATVKYQGKKQMKQAKRREERVIRRLEAKRDKHYTQAIVAYGLAFKAQVAVLRARSVVAGDSLSKQDRTESISDWELRYILEENKLVRQRAKRALKRKGVHLSVDRYSVHFYCN